MLKPNQRTYDDILARRARLERRGYLAVCMAAPIVIFLAFLLLEWRLG